SGSSTPFSTVRAAIHPPLLPIPPRLQRGTPDPTHPTPGWCYSRVRIFYAGGAIWPASAGFRPESRPARAPFPVRSGRCPVPESTRRHSRRSRRTAAGPQLPTDRGGLHLPVAPQAGRRGGVRIATPVLLPITPHVVLVWSSPAHTQDSDFPV